MSEIDNKIKYLLKKTGDKDFDVAMFINPIANREEFVIGEYCTLHKGDEILTMDGKVVTIASVDSCEVDSNWFHWIRSIVGDHCIHLVKARITYRNMFEWNDEEPDEEELLCQGDIAINDIEGSEEE